MEAARLLRLLARKKRRTRGVKKPIIGNIHFQ
jgi:hypothetical protein